jgi:hypothetical protein
MPGGEMRSYDLPFTELNGDFLAATSFGDIAPPQVRFDQVPKNP